MRAAGALPARRMGANPRNGENLKTGHAQAK